MVCKTDEKLRVMKLKKWIASSVPEFRSSRPEVFCKKGVPKNFAKFTGKHLCQSLFFNKVAGLGAANLLKKRLWHRLILTTPFLRENLRWLLLYLRDIFRTRKHQFLQPIFGQCFILIYPENTRKPKVFWCFQEV